MYEKEFEEGLSRLNPKIADMMRKAHEDAIRDEEMSGRILAAHDEERMKRQEEEKREKQEMMNMLDRAVEESKDYDK